MTIDRGKLRAILDGLQAGGTGMATLYGAYLDRLPKMFGSQKLADEADLILAALSAAELAYTAALKAQAPAAFETAGTDEDQNILFRPTAFEPVGGLPAEFPGVPLYALASALGRARERMSEDDEVYSANFVYVLFRLKAAIGVWRGDVLPDARYRLWLKDLAAIIAAHPRLGPKVIDCHRRMFEAVVEACQLYLPAFQAKSAEEPPPVFVALAATAFQHAVAAGVKDETESKLFLDTLWKVAARAGQRLQVVYFSSIVGFVRVNNVWQIIDLWSLAIAYMNLGDAKQFAAGYGPGAAIKDYNSAIEIMKDLRAALEPQGDWDPPMRNDLAKVYMNRGTAKRNAAGYGPAAAIKDYDAGIRITEDLRAALEPRGDWDPLLRNDLAAAYMNRGAAKFSAAGHGPGAAIKDYDMAIKIREDLRAALESQGDWDPPLRHDLANVYINRGIAKLESTGHGPGAAIKDYDAAIEIMEDLRAALEPQGDWNPPLRNDLAGAYMQRGTFKVSAAGHGPGAAIKDYDAAIEIMEDLRADLEPQGAWVPTLRNDLARAYMNSGTAKKSAAMHGPGAAIKDYEAAIEIMEDLRAALEPQGDWVPTLRNDLAMAYMSRGNAKLDAAGQGPGAAIKDYDTAIKIKEDLRKTLGPQGDWDPLWRDDLAMAYTNRGNAKRDAAGHGLGAAIKDFDAAIEIREDLLSALKPKGEWDPHLHNVLADTYMKRANAKKSAAGHGPGAAIDDYDVAIKIREDLRAALEPKGHWSPGLRNDLAVIYVNSGLCRQTLNDFKKACVDGGRATAILVPLLEAYSENAPPSWRQVARIAATLEAETCGAAGRSQVDGVSGTSSANPEQGDTA